jgi:hypothetical protein
MRTRVAQCRWYKTKKASSAPSSAKAGHIPRPSHNQSLSRPFQPEIAVRASDHGVGCANPIRIEIAAHVGIANRLLGTRRRAARPI